MLPIVVFLWTPLGNEVQDDNIAMLTLSFGFLLLACLLALRPLFYVNVASGQRTAVRAGTGFKLAIAVRKDGWSLLVKRDCGV